MNQPNKALKSIGQPCISLQVLVSNMLRHSQPLAVRRNTIIENEVDNGFVLGGAMQKAIPVMRELLTTVVSNSRNGDIHISADRRNDQLVVEIQERNNYNGYALAFSVGSLAAEAAFAGAQIDINGPQQKVVTISFVFPYVLQSA
ncbi:MAG: hypothetical protein JNM88_14625 [Chitinophagaceae bacterium]|nr:hypothetical protein [Chitinophagaceae bacterium]